MADAQARGWGTGWPHCQSDKYLKVTFSNGVKVVVRREIAELVKLLGEESIKQYPPKDGQTWGAACRPIAGTDPPIASNHSWGLAIDWNSLENPQRRPLTMQMPWSMAELWERFGFRSGARYVNSKPDPMHLEYMGTPATAAEHTRRARAEFGVPGHTPVPVNQEEDVKPYIVRNVDTGQFYIVASDSYLWVSQGPQSGLVVAFGPAVDVDARQHEIFKAGLNPDVDADNPAA